MQGLNNLLVQLENAVLQTSQSVVGVQTLEFVKHPSALQLELVVLDLGVHRVDDDLFNHSHSFLGVVSLHELLQFVNRVLEGD